MNSASIANRDGPYKTVKEAAEYLAVSVSTIYRLIRGGDLTIHRITSDSPRLSVGELEAFARSKGRKEGDTA